MANSERARVLQSASDCLALMQARKIVDAVPLANPNLTDLRTSSSTHRDRPGDIRFLPIEAGNRSSDQVIQHAREVRQKQIQDCSSRAARKILAQLSKGSKPTADTLTKLIAAEFDELSA